LGASIQAGRGFHSADVTSDANVVVVNLSFGRVVLGGRNPIGQRLRYVSQEETGDGRVIERPGPWHEIVGVVQDLAMWVSPDLLDQAGIYHPLSLGGTAPIRMAIRVEGDPTTFAPRLHSIASAADPEAVARVEPLADLARGYWNAIMFWFRILVVAGGVALLLALAGIYSVMSFTVSRRTREIGIRVALGSTPRRIVASMFSRGILQVGLGVLLGTAVWILFDSGDADPVTAKDAALVTAYAALMMLVCTLACIVPARRALRVQPTDALKAEA
jgi:predicted lysophospholipase L1 biosynthesis ABC-type transport system permease subunit